MGLKRTDEFRKEMLRQRLPRLHKATLALSAVCKFGRSAANGCFRSALRALT